MLRQGEDKERKKIWIMSYLPIVNWWQRWRTIKNPKQYIPMLFDTPEDANNKLNELGFEFK